VWHACRDAFHQLRTVEQIGYIVTTYVNVASAVPHIIFLLQSTTVGAAEMGTRIDAFLQQWRASLEVRFRLFRVPSPTSTASTSPFTTRPLHSLNLRPQACAAGIHAFQRVSSVCCRHFGVFRQVSSARSPDFQLRPTCCGTVATSQCATSYQRPTAERMHDKPGVASGW
jgi:hypothetical protein